MLNYLLISIIINKVSTICPLHLQHKCENLPSQLYSKLHIFPVLPLTLSPVLCHNHRKLRFLWTPNLCDFLTFVYDLCSARKDFLFQVSLAHLACFKVSTSEFISISWCFVHNTCSALYFVFLS